MAANIYLAVILENLAIDLTGAAERVWLVLPAVIRAAMYRSEVGIHRLKCYNGVRTYMHTVIIA